MCFIYIYIYIAQQLPMGQGLLIIKASRSHSGTPHSVWLLWMSDHPVAQTSTWQHATLTTDRHPCPRGDSNPQSQQASEWCLCSYQRLRTFIYIYYALKKRRKERRCWIVTLHAHTCSGRNRIIPLMRRPNTDNTPNKPLTLPLNQLLIRYVVTSPVHTVTIRCYGTR